MVITSLAPLGEGVFMIPHSNHDHNEDWDGGNTKWTEQYHHLELLQF